MGARELLHELAGAGFQVEAAGEKLVIKPASKLTDDIRTAVRTAKLELLRLLLPNIVSEEAEPCDPAAMDSCESFEERAAIMEFDGNLTRAEAEAAATGLLTATHVEPTAPARRRTTPYEQRRDRLLRWGWSEPEAEALAAKLTSRNGSPGAIHACVECRHYRPGQCTRPRAALLSSPDVGRALASIHQNCPAFARLEAQP